MIIIEPVKTEKAIAKIETENTLTFSVSSSATKNTIAKELETLFGVKVASVRTFITSKGSKHAVVRLQKGFKADDLAAKLKIIA
ncbi:50S ribosomal protein L23 [Candidatus Micrarchaeota archaeon]|nr:50S ribosomal protein L23 [Candidatus Micrarchaeota archaeon]